MNIVSVLNNEAESSHHRWTNIKQSAIALYDTVSGQSPLQEHRLQYITTQSALSPIFAQSSTVAEFQLIPSACGLSVIDDLILEIGFTMPSGSSALVPSFFFLQRLEVYTGNNQVEQWLNQVLYTYFKQTATIGEIQSGLATACNVSSTTLGLSGTSFTGAASYYVYIPMRGVFPAYSRILMSQLTEAIRYRFYFQGDSGIFIEGSGTTSGLTCNRLRLYYHGPRFNPAIESSILAAARGNTTYYRGCYGQFFTTNLGAITNVNNSVNQTLNSLSGRFIGVDFSLHSTVGNLAANQVIPLAVTDSGLIKMDGTYYDVSQTRQELRRYVYNNDQRPNALASNQDTVWYSFAENDVESLRGADKIDESGSATGSYVLTSLEQIQMSPTGNTASASLVVAGYRMSEIAVDPAGYVAYRSL